MQRERTDRSTGTILVVDSEVLVRSAISEYLRHCGYTVIEASTTDEALIALSAPQLRIDVVLSAAECAGALNGFGLATLIRKERPEVPVFVAGNVEKAAGTAADLCDEGPHLGRPYDPSLVAERIRRSLAGATRGNDT